MYKSLRSVPFRRSLSATKGLTSQPVVSRAEDAYNSQDFTKLGQEVTEYGFGESLIAFESSIFSFFCKMSSLKSLR